MTRVLAAAAMLVVALSGSRAIPGIARVPTPLTAERAPAAPRTTVYGTRVTYYTLSGIMRDGEWVYDGAAACGGAFPWLGYVTIHAAVDVTVQCVDTGYLGWRQIDVWSGYGRPWWLTQDWYDVDFW